MTPEPRHSAARRALACLCAALTCLTSPAASAQSLEDDDHDPAIQAIGGMAGAFFGLAAGAAVGVGVVCLASSGCNGRSGSGQFPIVGQGQYAEGIVGAGAFAGGVLGASLAAQAQGGPWVKEDPGFRVVLGAIVGGAAGLTTLALFDVLAGVVNPVQFERSGQGPDVLNLSLTALTLSAGMGIGAAIGYSSVYLEPFESLTVAPTLGADRAGVTLGFEF